MFNTHARIYIHFMVISFIIRAERKNPCRQFLRGGYKGIYNTRRRRSSPLINGVSLIIYNLKFIINEAQSILSHRRICHIIL